MRKLLAIVLCLPLLVQAQSWFPPEAVWHYWYGGMGQVAGFVRIVQIGDSIINEQPCHILRKTQEYVSLFDYSYETQAIGRECAYEQDGLVMAFDPGVDAFDTLYNMNAVPGDHWRLADIPDGSNVCDPLNHMLVTDTGTVVIDGIGLRWLAVNVNYITSPLIWEFYQDTIIDRIGSTEGYLLPQDFCLVFLDGNEAGPFRCYTDADIFFMDDESVPCEMTVGEQEYSLGPAIGLFPNPGDGGAFVTLPCEAKNAVVHVIDGTGRLSHRDQLSNGAWLDLSTLPSGLYQVRIDCEGLPSPYFTRWVKS